MENTWHKKVNLPNNEVLALHGPQLVVHFTVRTSSCYI